MKKTFLLILIVLITMLTACTRKVGWVGSNIGNSFDATYQVFEGEETEKIRLSNGDRFSLNYDIIVEKGALTLQIRDPNKTLIWEESFRENIQDSLSFSAETGGRYTLDIIGDETQGGFDLQWEIKE
jgi:hypothetical protein